MFDAGDKLWYFLYMDTKHRQAYRGFEARLGPKTAEIVSWEENEEGLDEMVDAASLLEHVKYVALHEDDEAVGVFTEDDLLLLAEQEVEQKPARVSCADRKADERLRKKAGTQQKLQELIEQLLERDCSCVS